MDELTASAHQPNECCPLVFTVPAVMAPPSSNADRTPMLYITPMAAPVMMPVPALERALVFGNMPYASTTEIAPHLYWPSFGILPSLNQANSEEAPQQLPMTTAIPATTAEPFIAASSSRTSDMSQEPSFEDVPQQLHMATSTTDSALAVEQVQFFAFSEACTPRWFDSEDADQGHEEETEIEFAQSQEIVNTLLVQLRTGGVAREVAIASFERLAFAGKVTSRAAQMILREIPASEAAALASGLEGHVRNATQSKHANYVLQRIIEVMPVSYASFITEELRGFGQEVARHRFGCRVFCRILEHVSPNHAPTLDLVEELFQDLHSLCNHGFGSFVVRHLLEFGLPEHKHRIASTLLTGLVEFSKHKFASHVVEGAFLHCAFEDQEALARDLIRDHEQLLTVATHQFGRHVARALLRMPGGLKKQAVDALSPWQYRLKSSRYGKSVLPSLRTAAASIVN